jgi:hypothetical protein
MESSISFCVEPVMPSRIEIAGVDVVDSGTSEKFWRMLDVSI